MTEVEAGNFGQGGSAESTLSLGEQEIAYDAIADWLTLYKEEKPIAKMFFCAYFAQSNQSAQRPLTFVFNGGPGAASAYLHMGAVGPKRLLFGHQGSLPRPPVKVLDNHESWLSFSDLVFVDPIGTGFSRALPPEAAKEDASTKGDEKVKETPFWEMDRDLRSLGEFIVSFLTKYQRWLSPIYIAGESYGGFRVAKLTKMLQQDFGVGLSGALLISPALEFSFLDGGDYNLSYWATLVPAFAAVAVQHGRSKWVGETGDWSAQLGAAEQFARQTLIPFLALGDLASENEAASVYEQLANLTGLSTDLVSLHQGRIERDLFARELLRDQRLVVGLYDGSVTSIDPFPDRLNFEGSDPTLDGSQRLFTAAVNHHLRDTLGVETELTYKLLNFDVFKAWRYNKAGQNDFKQGYVGAVDDLRVGLTLNPHLRIMINHGYFDLVTTYFASDYLVALMKTTPQIRDRIHQSHYLGGHMFYSWESSRKQWYQAVNEFYNDVKVS
ncbi:MAG: peptidase S10 [Cyanobacteria bacterium P01_H01_bin.15]